MDEKQQCTCGLCVASFVDAVIVEAEQEQVQRQSRTLTIDDVMRRVGTPLTVPLAAN